MISSNVFYYRNDLPKRVKLIAVSKNVPVPKLRIAKESGVKRFGESRIQEAIPKVKAIPEAEWHFIGHLQRNKVKTAVKYFDVIQSVDSSKLAKKIDNAAKEHGKKQKVMVQLKFGGKHGFHPKDAKKAVKKVSSLRNLQLLGMMVIGHKKDPIPSFKKANRIFEKHKLKHLSMGMSNDYTEALKFGSNMVRIGRGIFDEKKY